MTFYEAAVEVLREAGRPLHYKKITEISIRRELLSHVGKTPEITMGARLEIEASKPVGETLLVRVRPGIYSLRDGADAADSSQTIRPRGYVESPIEDEGDDETPAVEGASAEPSEAKPTAEGGADGDQAAGEGGGRRRRRRGRRGGRGRGKDGAEGGDGSEGADADGGDGADGDVDGAESDSSPDPGESEAPTPVAAAPGPTPAQAGNRNEGRTPRADRGERSDRGERGDRAERGDRGDRQRGGRSQHATAEAAPPAAPETLSNEPRALHEAGDIARAIVDILRTSSDRSMHARGLAAELAQRRVAGLGKLGPSALREHIEFANARRTRIGRPPLFEEVRPNQWALAVASGNNLAVSYAALDSWQDRHREALSRTLLDRVNGLNPDQLVSIVGLTLDRLQYRGLTVHEPVGDELVTISGTAPRALTSARVAVRVARPGSVVTREKVSALRGALHLYQATEAAYVSLSGFEPAAQSEAQVANLAPIELVSAERFIEHMLAASVGVSTFHVDVRYIDESLFRDLHGG